jgi:hypothetical protein
MQFTDAEFMTANQKTLVFNTWKRFVEAVAAGKTGDELLKHFKEPLYKHLTLHCGGFIAHYNRDGFFGTYFEEPEDTVRFFSQFDPDGPMRSIEGGYDWWVRGGNGTQAPYHDLNNAMCEATRPHLAAIRNYGVVRQREADLARANALLSKHGRATVS